MALGVLLLAAAALVTAALARTYIVSGATSGNAPQDPTDPDPNVLSRYPRVPPRAASEVAYPLRVSASRRYLVDARGRPFLLLGDSPQALIVNVSLEHADRYLANRRAAGFNAVWVNLLCTDATGGRPDGSTYDGIVPFLKPGDLSTPNEAYFARVDAMVELAAKHGIAVLLDPIETKGWLSVLRANGLGEAYAYGLYLGRRYRRFPNVVWLNGNDFQSWRNWFDNRLVLAVARGIRAADPRHLQTVELDYSVSASLDNPAWRGDVDLDAVYTYYPTYAKLLAEYRRRDFRPTFLVEANYEFEHDFTGPETLRRQEYWALLSGATGQLYGNKYTWQFLEGWQDYVDTAGSAQLWYVTGLFAARPWFRLVPDGDHRLVTAGYGRFADDGTVGDNDYVTAARTPEGTLAIAYLPAGNAVTVNLAALAGRVQARWYDPTTGRYRPAAVAPLPNRGSRRFRPPGKNRDGDTDWVLVLTARKAAASPR